MELTMHVILTLLLGLIFYQDWKYRAISWVVFPALLITTAYVFWQANASTDFLYMNFAFLVLVFAGLLAYLSLKRARLVNIFKADFGLGDLLFLIAVIPLFSDRNFILFFISGMLFSGLIHLLVFQKTTGAKIPLAGYLAVYLLVIKSAGFLTGHDLFYNSIL